MVSCCTGYSKLSHFKSTQVFLLFEPYMFWPNCPLSYVQVVKKAAASMSYCYTLSFNSVGLLVMRLQIQQPVDLFSMEVFLQNNVWVVIFVPCVLSNLITARCVDQTQRITKYSQCSHVFWCGSTSSPPGWRKPCLQAFDLGTCA